MSSPSPKYALFSEGMHICLMKSLIILFPVLCVTNCPRSFQCCASHIVPGPHFENVEFKPRYIYIYIKCTVFVNVTTKSAQQAHAWMIAKIYVHMT